MKVSLTLIAVVVAVTVASGDQTQTPVRDQATVQKGTSVLKGQVVDAITRAPVRRAMVRASALDVRAGGSVLTDPDGRFEIGALPAGRYTIVVDRSGYLSTVYGRKTPTGPGATIELLAGQTAEKIVIPIAKGGVIAGRVFDEFGEPVAGANIQALQLRYQGGSRRLSQTGTVAGATDDLGAFRIYGLQPGQYYVSVRPNNTSQFDGMDTQPTGPTTTYFPNAPDPSTAQRVAVVAGREVAVTISLVSVRLSRIRGRAVMSTGEPFAQAFVDLTIRDSNDGFRSGGGSPVRADGSFEITGVAPGTYTLTVRPMNFNRDDDPEVGRTLISVAGEDVHDVWVVGSRPGMARGRIVSDDGSALPFQRGEVMINAMAPVMEDRFMISSQVRVNADLSFEIRGLLGTQLIRATAVGTGGWQLKQIIWNGEDITDRGVEFHSGRVVDGIDIVFTRKTTRLSGAITDDRGEIVRDTWIVMFPSDPALWPVPSRFVRATRPSPKGEFQFVGLPPYDDYLIAVAPDMEPGQDQDPEFLRSLRDRSTRVSLQEGETKTQNLRIGRLPQ
jgi:hypothetical protein